MEAIFDKGLIDKEKEQYFKNLEKKFRRRFKKMTEWERENLNDYFFNEIRDYLLRYGKFNSKSEWAKACYIEFFQMFVVVELGDDDPTPDYAFELAKEYVKYKRINEKKEW
jgi:hypothetical protein